MRVLHVPFSYLPEPPGGTELYVRALAGIQQQRGADVVIAAPGKTNATYEHNGVNVRRYAVAAQLTLDQLWGDGDPVAAQNFAALLDQVRPDLVHLHAYTSGVSLLCAQEIGIRSLPSVFTYHTPTSSCPRGTLMRWGRVPCDGLLLDHRCGACMLGRMGAPQPAAQLAERPLRWLSKLVTLPGPLGTGTRVPELTSARIRANLRFLELQRRIIVQAEWSRAVLLRNSVAEEKITLVRHGLPHGSIPSLAPRSRGKPLRIGFFGRLDPTKGLHLLAHAVSTQPDLPIRVDAFVVAQPGAEQYGALLNRIFSRDARLHLHGALPHDQVMASMASFDAVAVPSLWFETGPLTVLEAFAAAVPVLGTPIGGVAELVQDGVNGLIIEAELNSWQYALGRLVREPALLDRLRPDRSRLRRMEDVANETDAVYAQAT